jgi:DeoR/GlpR family transcriptional regulator of sugar metabolism
MGKQTRQEDLLRILQEKGHANAQQLSSLLGVSEVTVRRDFNALESEGLIRRIYGGAIPANPSLRRGLTEKLLFDERANINAKEKSAIALCAAQLIREHEAIYLDIGTTIAALADVIQDRENLTVLTNSLAVLNVLSGSALKIYSIGGLLNGNELSISGNIASSFVQNFNIDNAFIGVGGITLQNGISDYFYETTQLRKAVIERAHQVTLLADSSKFGTDCFSVICPLDRISTIITDTGLSEMYRQEIRSMGINLILAEI